MMNRIVTLAAALSALAVATVSVLAQSIADNDGDALQRSLKERALRLPARAREAVAARETAPRAALARTVAGRPDLAALRADLSATREADAERRRRLLNGIAGPQVTGPQVTERQVAGRQGEGANAGEGAAPPPGLRALVAERLANVERSEIERVRVPVLIPAHPDIRDRIRVYGMENVYTATAEIDPNAALSITGTCNRVIGGDPDVAAFRKRLAAGPSPRTALGAAYHISRNDFGVDLSFSRFGCGYVMTVECSSPADDVRCAGDGYISALAGSMILANPELAEGE